MSAKHNHQHNNILKPKVYFVLFTAIQNNSNGSNGKFTIIKYGTHSHLSKNIQDKNGFIRLQHLRRVHCTMALNTPQTLHNSTLNIKFQARMNAAWHQINEHTKPQTSHDAGLGTSSVDHHSQVHTILSTTPCLSPPSTKADHISPPYQELKTLRL